MKILILKNTICGGTAVEVGDIVEASSADARLLIAMHKAVKAIAQPAIETTDAPPKAEVAVAAPAKRGRPRRSKK